MPGTFMNQTTVTIVCVFLSSVLSTVGATYQTNKANEEKEHDAFLKITSEFNGVKMAVTNFSSQLNSLRTDSSVLESKVESLQEWRRGIDTRVRDIEMRSR